MQFLPAVAPDDQYVLVRAESRNIKRSKNDSPTPPVCSLQLIFILYTHIGVAFDNSEKPDIVLLENNN